MAAHVHHITERHPRAQRDAVFCLANVSSERGIPGRKPSRAEQHIEVLRAITREQPRSSLDEVTRELKRRTGMAACSATVGNALRQAGMRRLKPLRKLAERAAAQGGKPLRVGYTDAHWREDGSSGVNPDLTAAEWALVADLFEHDEALRGRPPKHPRKLMVNACCYVVRTGCAGRLLPKCFPPGHVVYKSFSRWVVERTRAWNARAGHLISHHDIAHHDRSSWAPAAWIWLAEARVPATKLVK